MRDLINHNTIPDEEVYLSDGFVYIISQKRAKDYEYSIDVICLIPEYDDPISLKDIAEKYPNVIKVLYEDYRKGYVYNYGNYEKGEWDLNGTTMGFA